MPTWTGAGADNNWSTAANWDTGVPAAGTTAVFDGVAANGNKNCTITAGATCVSINTTGYTGQLDFANGLSVGGNVTWGAGTTFGAGTAALTIRATSTYTSNSITFPNTLILINTLTLTLAADATIGGLTTTGGYTYTINSNILSVNGNIGIGGDTGGTTEIKTAGNGTLTTSAAIRFLANKLTINSTYAFSGIVYFRGGVLTHTGVGTFTTTGSTLYIQNNCTLTSNGKEFGNLTLDSTTLTLTDNLTINTLLTISSGAITINGFKIDIKGSLQAGGAFGGTTNLFIIGSGSWTGSGFRYVRNNITINTTGNFSISGTVYFGGASRTLTYIPNTGTVSTTGSNIFLDSTVTLVSNGLIWEDLSPSGASTVITLSDNATCRDLTSFSGGAGNTLNGNNIFVTRNLSIGIDMGGTTVVNLTGVSGNITVGANRNLASTLVINRTGATSFTGTDPIRYSGPTITHTAGTINPGTLTFLSLANTTFNINSSGFVLWNWQLGQFSAVNATINTGTITVNNNMTFAGNTTFAGTGGWTVNNLTDSTAGRTLSLKDGSTYTVTGNLALTGTNASPFVVQSSSATLRAILTLNQGANQTVQFVRATRIDSSGGQTIWDTVGTIVTPLTDTINWNNGSRPAPSNTLRMA